MDLIERYLAAIARQLPGKQAADITAELRDVLLSRVEEREAALGRPLHREEFEALLIDFGNPLVVAGRYRKVQHVIGPEVFPFWWAAVKTVLLVVGGIYLVLIAIAVVTHKTQAEFNLTVPSFWYVAVYLFGMITLVCMGIERFGKAQILQRWTPRNLPPAMDKPRSRFALSAEIAWDVVFILWWLGLVRFSDFLPEPPFISIALAPVWDAWRWPIVAYAGLEIAVNLLAILRPARAWTIGALSIGRYLTGMAILGAILRAGHWLVVSDPYLSTAALSQTQANFDLGMRIGIIVAIMGMAIRIGHEAWRLWRLRRAQAGGLAPA